MIQTEAAHREFLWDSLLASVSPDDVRPSLIWALGLRINGHQRGLFVSSATRNPQTPKGLALSFLNTGAYDDEVTDTGVIYHYPKTLKPGHDESEITATKAAYRAGLPVFFIGLGRKSTTRSVRRGYIEDMDDQSRLLLITFTDEKSPTISPPAQQESFQVTSDETTVRYGLVKKRPNQARFAFDVYKRYGYQCAVCGLNVNGLLQAAHLVPKRLKGSDDSRNGLPLCANHHLAFDRDYWCMDIDLRLHFKKNGPDLEELAITHEDLSHLRSPPHQKALEFVWTRWCNGK
ncbi:HNH endonuclease [Paenarthrobacter ilicis]|uniref:HNH endonuclease n=1 Tax=Paenarthrobacter ilicis TaxID=43665 RepID=UPI00300915B8